MPHVAHHEPSRSPHPAASRLTLRQRFIAVLRKAYWPVVTVDALPNAAIHRALAVFCLLGSLMAIGVTLLFAHKNFVVYPLQGILQMVMALALLLAPVAMALGVSVRWTAHAVIGLCFVGLTYLCFNIDGLLSSKAIFFVSLAMTSVLMFGPAVGGLWTLATIAVLVALHTFRDGIRGNLTDSFTVDDMSLVMLVGLTTTLLFVLVGGAVFVREMQRAIRGLREARVEAQAADRAKSRFIASIGHELRAPLTGIQHIATLLEDNATSADRLRLIKTVGSSSQSLLTVIDDILDVAKLESRGVKLVEKPFNLRVVAERVLHLLSGKASAKSLSLRLLSQPDMPAMLHGDPVRIGQVVSNLVDNAIKYTDYGVVSIELTAVRDGDHVIAEIRVADTGVGIAEADQAQIFEPFTQNDAQGADGVGLGLSIVHGLVTAMHGQINLLSEPGHGSQFRITLPLRQAPVEAEVPPASAKLDVGVWAVAATGGVEGMSLETLHAIAASVRTFDNPDKLVEELRVAAAPPDVVVLADSHAHRYALRAAEVIRRLPQGGNLPVQIITDELTTDRLQRLYRLADCRMLLLPATPADILGTIELLTASSAAPADDQGRAGDEGARRARLLIAEDNAINRSFLQRFLPTDRFDVSYAVDGADAIDCWRDHPFDLVLMDISMPVLDGVEATQEIRRLEAELPRARTPIVALTAYSTLSDRQRFDAAGIDDYLAKPYRLGDMIRTIERWVGISADPATPTGDALLRGDQPT